MAKLQNCNVLKKQTLGSVLVLILLAQELQACSKKIALMCLQHLRFFPTIVQRFLSAGLFTHYHLQTCISSSSCAAMDMNLICNTNLTLQSGGNLTLRHRADYTVTSGDQQYLLSWYGAQNRSKCEYRRDMNLNLK